MVICVGEILADMIGKPAEDGTVAFSRHAGGAPFNVACGVRASGGSGGFIGRVGDDITGRFLIGFAQKQGLDFLKIEKDPDHNTTLAFVELDENGERSFCFARKFAADYRIADPFDKSLSGADIVHIGSLMLSEPIGQKTWERAFAAAKRAGKKVSFDVNFRSDLFSCDEKTRELFLSCIERADIVKVSEEELCFLCRAERKDTQAWYAEPLLRLCGKDKIVALTLGAEGCAVCCGREIYRVNAKKVAPVDTTGAGDSFYAAFLSGLDRRGCTPAAAAESAKEANVAAAYTVAQYGAIVPLPDRATIEREAAALSAARI